MPRAQRTQIIDRAAVFAAMTDLAGDGDEIRLQLPDAPDEYRFTVHAVDAAEQRVLFVSAETSAVVPPIEIGNEPVLHARRRAGHLSSSPMRCDLMSRDDRRGALLLRCRLPKELVLRHARDDWRARVLPDEMTVAVSLIGPDGQRSRGRLVDLSVGGSRIELCPAPDRMPAIGVRLHVELAFPNGESATIAADMRQFERGAAAVRLGLAFIDVAPELLRRLWFYTCEIDREAVRRTRSPGELYRLAPSRLFATPS